MSLLLTTLVSTTARAQESRDCVANIHVFQQGELLEYEVTYMGIPLGTISTRVAAVDSTSGVMQFRVEGLIRTYKGVPFVTLNTLYRSVMSESLASVGFYNKEFVSDSVNKHITYTFHPIDDRVVIDERVDGMPQRVRSDTLDLEGKRWQDGLSLLFYARAFARSSCNRKVPVLMYRSKAVTDIHFGVDHEEEDIDAVDYDVSTVKIEGETGFTGIFGLTGGFEGWFSDDAASVPICAKMHVLIGSVRLELVRWKRGNWKPPRTPGKRQ